MRRHFEEYDSFGINKMPADRIMMPPSAMQNSHTSPRKKYSASLVPQAKGFTLIELMVVIAITAILAALALPDFMSVTRQTRLRAEANALANAIKYARSEAIRQNIYVTLCRSITTHLGSPTCETGTGISDVGWAAGWIVFLDTNQNGSRNTTETMLTVKNPASNGITMVGATGGGATNRLSFNASGDPTGPNRGAGTVAIKENQDESSALYFVVNSTGRIRILTNAQCLADPNCLNPQ